jgi:DNA-binding CsgD family transcriptional regulator
MANGWHHKQAEGDPQIDQMRYFALGSLSASSSVFYWIDEQMEMADVELTGNCRQTFHLYERQMKAYDPLNIARLVNSQKRVSKLSDDFGLAPEAQYERYSNHLKQNRVSDVLDFLFWDSGVPFAGLGIIKHPDEAPFDADTHRQAALMQNYMEYNLSSHPRLKLQRLNFRLSNSYGLTKREIEIAKLISLGMTNQNVVDELAIGLSTVKTHLMHIFVKLGIENRGSLPARIDHIAADASSSN